MFDRTYKCKVTYTPNSNVYCIGRHVLICIEELHFELPLLYKMGATNVLVWSIRFHEHLSMSSGTIDNLKKGSLRNSERIVTTNRTGRNKYQQALLQAEEKWKRKQDVDGYAETLISKNIYESQSMLANRFYPQSNQIKKWPVYVQPKLDGVRCRIHTSEDKVIIMGRNNYGIKYLEHIQKAYRYLEKSILHILAKDNLLPYFRLDGELYSFSKLSFDELNGITRYDVAKQSSKEKHISYVVFDIIVPTEMPYSERYSILYRSYEHLAKRFKLDIVEKNYLYNIQHYPIRCITNATVSSNVEICGWNDIYEEYGYEGTIIRRPEAPYIHRRCTSIYKYKTFEDGEYEIVDAKTEKTEGHPCIIWICQTKEGKRFSCKPGGKAKEREEYTRKYFENPKAFKGKLYRCKFQSFFESGIPRFPTGIGFVTDRDEECEE